MSTLDITLTLVLTKRFMPVESRSKESKSDKTENKQRKCRKGRVEVGRRRVYGNAYFECIVLRNILCGQ